MTEQQEPMVMEIVSSLKDELRSTLSENKKIKTEVEQMLGEAKALWGQKSAEGKEQGLTEAQVRDGNDQLEQALEAKMAKYDEKFREYEVKSQMLTSIESNIDNEGIKSEKEKISEYLRSDTTSHFSQFISPSAFDRLGEVGYKSANMTTFDPRRVGYIYDQPFIDSIMNIVKRESVMDGMIRHVNLGSKDRYTRQVNVSEFATENRVEGQISEKYNLLDFQEFGFGYYQASASYITTPELLQDASFDIEGELMAGIAKEFTRRFNYEYLHGNGVKECNGILKYPESPNVEDWKMGTLGRTVSENSQVIGIDDLLELQAVLKNEYQDGAVWMMHPRTWIELQKLSTQNQHYFLAFNSQSTSTSATSILTRPVILNYYLDKPVKDNTGVIKFAVNDQPIIYGNFNTGYIALEKNTGYNLFKNPFLHDGVKVKVTLNKAHGGGIVDFDALKILKIS